MEPSTLQRLMSSSNAQMYSRSTDLGNTVPKHFVKYQHPVHEGDPYKNIGTSRNPRYIQHIPGDKPIGDQEKLRRQREAEMRQQEMILKQSLNPSTIQHNV